MAIECVFAKLAALNSHFDFRTVTEPGDPRQTHQLGARVGSDMDAYVKRFKSVDEDQS